MKKQTLLQQVAHWITRMHEQRVPDDVVTTAKTSLADFFAVAAAGFDMPVAQNARAYMQTNARPGRSVVIGSDKKVDVSSAAFVNGVAAHALDLDDVTWTIIGHPTVAIAPAALAITQERRGTGEDFIKGYVVGVEVAMQIGRWTMPNLSENGWHTTIANGIFGACAASCYLRHYSEAVTLNALGLAASMCCGLRANFGSQTKATHAGLSNELGMKAAALAACGITSNADVLEAVDGYAHCFANPINVDECKCELGTYWDLRESGLVIKKYPCCSGIHPTLDVWDEFLSEHPVAPENVESIDLGVSLLGPRELISHMPQDSIQAKFSMEFGVAARLVYGEVTPETYTDEKVLNPVVQTLMSKMHMYVHPDFEALGFIGSVPIKLTLKCKDGSTFELSNDMAKGNPEKPFSPQEHKSKFYRCCKGAVPSNVIDSWWNVLENLESASDEEFGKLGAL